MPDKILNRQFVCIFMADSLMYLGQFMVQTLITKYAYTLGASATIMGVVASAFAITAIIFKIISGPAIDSFNRKAILICGMVIMASSYFGYAISGSVPSVIGFRLLQGAGQAFTTTCCLTLAADSLPPDRMGTGIGFFTLAQSIAQAIAPQIGLTIANNFGFQAVFMVAGIIVFFAAAMAMNIRVVHSRTRKQFKISLNNTIAREALLPCALSFLLCACFYLINSFLVVYAAEMGIDDRIGYYFTVYALTLLATRPAMGKLSDRYGFLKVGIPAMMCFAASFFIISYARNLPVFLLAAFVAAFGYGACTPMINALSMKSVPQSRRGAASSTSYIGIDMGSLVGPTLAGFVATQTGYSSMWRYMTIPIFAAVAVTLLFRNRIITIEQDFLQRTKQ